MAISREETEADYRQQIAEAYTTNERLSRQLQWLHAWQAIFQREKASNKIRKYRGVRRLQQAATTRVKRIQKELQTLGVTYNKLRAEVIERRRVCFRMQQNAMRLEVAGLQGVLDWTSDKLEEMFPSDSREWPSGQFDDFVTDFVLNNAAIRTILKPYVRQILLQRTQEANFLASHVPSLPDAPDSQLLKRIELGYVVLTSAAPLIVSCLYQDWQRSFGCELPQAVYADDFKFNVGVPSFPYQIVS